MPFKHTSVLLFAVLLSGVPACGGAPVQPSVALATSSSAVAKPAKSDEAHRLVIAATGCWFGGVWRDALEEPQQPSVDRCEQVLEQVYGKVDAIRLERMRAIEAVEVSDLADRLGADGNNPSRARPLAELLNAVADAERETMLARRAGDRIKKDISGDREPGKRPGDERESVLPLTKSEALLRLLRFDAGALRGEAHAIGLMCALDRIQTARGLPKHLKVYAAEGVYEMLFGIQPPVVPEDVTLPMKAGAWLAYLSEVAGAAKHPVPVRAISLEDKELMAWGGVLEGLSDKLRDELDGVSDRTELRRVVAATIERLDTEYRASEAALLAERAGPTSP